MSETALAVAESPVDLSIDSAVSDYIENTSRTDGSRTPIWKIARIHQMKRDGASVNRIGEILGMDSRTINAVLSRQDHLVTDARMLLKANALGFAGDLIQASQEAAKRGKTEGIAAVLDRLGVTEPPKSGQQTSVGVQVILNGGSAPAELSLAKVVETSEGQQNQAGKSEGLISPVPSPSNSLDCKDLSNESVSHAHASQQAHDACVLQQDTLTIQANKCESAPRGDSL